MNASQAKRIAIRELLRERGAKPVKHSVANDGSQMELYFSPFREEQTPSFWLNLDKNVFNDFGGIKGNVLDFAMELEETDLVGALKWLSARDVGGSRYPKTGKYQENGKQRLSFEILENKEIYYFPIKNYIEKRGISLSLATRYLEEVRYKRENENSFRGVGMKNEAGGYEVRSFGESKFHTCVGPKAISVFRGKDERLADIFESSFDFLSFLMLAKLDRPQGSAFVLHSVTHDSQAIEQIKDFGHYKKIRLWLDNDAAGDRAVGCFAELKKSGFAVRDMRHKYADHKDLNDFLVARKGL